MKDANISVKGVAKTVIAIGIIQEFPRHLLGTADFQRGIYGQRHGKKDAGDLLGILSGKARHDLSDLPAVRICDGAAGLRGE